MARVLVVENDPATRMLLALHLESDTHDVITACDGREGLKQAIEATPDLILSDARMPQLDGIDFLAGLRSNARTAAIPFIFLTDPDDGDVRERSSTLRVADYLVKPLDRDRLLEAVSRQTTERTQLLGPDWTAEGDGEWCDTMVLEPGADDAGHSATMIMAPHYAVPTPDAALPARDVDTQVVDGTVAFFAIRDFPRIASAIGEDLQVELLQEFHTKARELVEKNGGWIVKTSEGGFIAMFEEGASAAAHHAERAGKAIFLSILALQRFTPWLAARLRDPHGPRLVAVAGLNSGPVSVCNLRGGRAAHRTERTIIGDTVNVASRLQSSAGDLGWGVICSDTTLAGVGSRFGTGREGQITVKGRKAPVKVVELTNLRPKAGADSGERTFYSQLYKALAANTGLIDRENTARAAGGNDPTVVVNVRLAAGRYEAPIEVEGYGFVRKIGEGGAGQVHLARHERSGAERVLKLVRLSDEYDGEAAKRFVQEYALLMQVAHRGVAEVYQHGHEGGYAYMAMEYFAGGDLRAMMKQKCSPTLAVSSLMQIAGGLSAVHRTGVVHRDLKPDNIMLRADGSMAIADFGIAKKIGAVLGPTQHGDILGTPYYLSPEQVQNLPADHRSDIYSVGVMFYEMLTGERAYSADSVVALMDMHVKEPVPVLPVELSRFQPLLERMMSKNIDRRFGGASEIGDFLTHYRLL